MSSLTLIGLNHKTADVSLREKLNFSSREIEETLPQLINIRGINEAVLLSTCNRTELMLYSCDCNQARQQALSLLAAKGKFADWEISPILYQKNNNDAVTHVFKVACGLDSMVLGESQIVGQVKEAFEIAIDSGAAKKTFIGLYQYTQRTVKRVRTETGIDRSAVSISHAAVELSKKIFGQLTGKKALIVGAGEMCELAATNLGASGVTQVDVANRTLSRAQTLAHRFGGRAYSFEERYQAMEEVDIVLTSTGATGIVIEAATMKTIMKKRHQRPLFIIDIAVPRDVEIEVGAIADVYLYNIDDLKQVIAANKKKRQCEMVKALSIIEQQVEQYQTWCRLQGLNPLISDLFKQAEKIRQEELKKSKRKLQEFPEQVHQELDRLSANIVNKLLHQPVTSLKQAVSQEQQQSKLPMFFRYLFNLK